MDLWAEYLETRDINLRNQLVTNYMRLVRYVAARQAQQLPGFLDPDDLISYGVFGLIDAIERYDPAMGTKFETFGAPRIRGAILDELRSQDWAPRSVRSQARDVQRGTEHLRNQLGREPSRDELAEHLDVDVQTVNQAKANAVNSMVNSLDQPNETTDNPDAAFLPHHLQPVSNDASDPAMDVEAAAMHEVLADSISWLPVLHQRIVWHYYVEGLKMREIGELLGIGSSKVCQLYTEIVLLLRERMAVLR